ncbi:hypothetical protein EKO23_07080 [Nocardioides guangzhouensis]|uniref:Uncharacterized protein n=1 Tax=Nocardioides guangzhouensis TaxID=2497878 RepID=A0A4Q4ZFX4_9ACTN|nr:hypothetical protein [Nocardioides guangzhouensis]RYP87033.1 hypothetical protein EKO23_07080 [Nocardioides guangzhouensis]
MDLTTCPECGELAEVQWRAVLESTDGPVEHARVQCVRRHWFLLPVASLALVDRPAVPERRRVFHL